MLRIHPDFQAPFKRLGLDCAGRVLSFFQEEDAEPEIKNRIRRIDGSRLQGGNQPGMFLKTYGEGTAQWRFLGRKSKACLEYENYGMFHDLKIPTLQEIACGEFRDRWGRLEGAFILTEELPNTQSLVEFFLTEMDSVSGKTRNSIQRSIIRQLAAIVRKLHGSSFYHHDLVWRNVLIQQESPDQPRVFLMDCPRGGREHLAFLRNRRRIKDLASLDKRGAMHASLRQRLTFLRHYLGASIRSEEARHLKDAVQNYRKARWPEDWIE